MILWRAKYGYKDGELSNNPNLSEITFTDEGPIGFPTNMNPPANFSYATYRQSISTSSTPSFSTNSSGNLAIALEQLLGEDYYKMYLAPSPLDSRYKPDEGYQAVYDVMPSALLAAPNLLKIMFDSYPNYYDTFIYIPSLKKLLYYGMVYNVLSDGKLQLLSTGTSTYGPHSALQLFTNSRDFFWGYWPIAYGYDGTKESLINGEQYFLQVEFSHMYYEYCINKAAAGVNVNQSNFWKALFTDFVEPDWSDDGPPPDPDPPEGNIDTGTTLPGGYDPDSDEIPWDVPNWLSASDLGMCTVYNPSVEQVKSLATRLYSKDFQSGFENYIWGNPIESIIGLSVFPCPIPNGGTATVKSWGLDTGVTMTLAGTTLVHVSCGVLPVPSVYEGYLDYSPYTQAEVYIPYVGFVGLDVDDIMGQNLQLHYYIDIISGSATCKLVISNTSTTTVLGQWSCQVGRQIPIGSKDYNDIINAGIQLVAAAVSAYSGSVIPEIVTDLGDALQYEGGGFNGTKFGTQMLRAGSSAIMQAKPNITRGSAIASAAGQLAVQYPYLILKRPVSAKTNGYGALVGYPTFKYGNIGAYTGFVRCHNIKLDNIGCTDWELSEIFRLCCEGVYI